MITVAGFGHVRIGSAVRPRITFSRQTNRRADGMAGMTSLMTSPRRVSICSLTSVRLRRQSSQLINMELAKQVPPPAAVGVSSLPGAIAAEIATEAIPGLTCDSGLLRRFVQRDDPLSHRRARAR
jgi:hypothetical protein